MSTMKTLFTNQLAQELNGLIAERDFFHEKTHNYLKLLVSQFFNKTKTKEEKDYPTLLQFDWDRIGVRYGDYTEVTDVIYAKNGHNVVAKDWSDLPLLNEE